MKQIFLIAGLVAALCVPTIAAPPINVQLVALTDSADAIVSTAADTTEFTAYQTGWGDYMCGPLTCFVKETENSDSSDITLYWEYSADPSVYGYVLFDSLNLTASTGTATETRYYVDTLLVDNIIATHFRLRIQGDVANDKLLGSAITINLIGAPCRSGN